MTITYGLSVNTADSEVRGSITSTIGPSDLTYPRLQYITHAEDTMEMISQATVPGAFLCDLIPCSKSRSLNISPRSKLI